MTASAAFEEKVVRPGRSDRRERGKIRFGARVIDDDHNYGILSFTDVLVKSSNVGAIKVGSSWDRIAWAVHETVGFGRRTSPDFPGESAGIMWDPAKLTNSALASVSMGYQVGVTPLQMAAAVELDRKRRRAFEPRIVGAVMPTARARRAATRSSAARCRPALRKR